MWAWARHIETELEVNELIELCSRLLEINLVDNMDSWEWIGAENKVFSVGAVKNLLNKSGQQGGDQQTPFDECKWILNKINIFMWRAAANKIATVEALRIRHIEVQEDSCAFCNDGIDSVAHIFSSCYAASVVWNQISSWCKVQNLFFFGFEDISMIHEFVGFSGAKKEAFKGIVRIAAWCLWKARNKARFEQKEIRIGEIVNKVKALGFLWFKYRSRFGNIVWDDWCKFVIMQVRCFLGPSI
ncbi:putative reverse transcriptase zinc-binding domain-containing protein [Helianthus anomalus]